MTGTQYMKNLGQGRLGSFRLEKETMSPPASMQDHITRSTVSRLTG